MVIVFAPIYINQVLNVFFSYLFNGQSFEPKGFEIAKITVIKNGFQVLGLPTISVGLTAALPTLLQFAVKMVAGTASDKILSFSETSKVG